MNITIDAKRCVGHARCLFYAPTVFGFDDDGNQAILLDETPSEDFKPLVQQAVANCPERAITADLGTEANRRDGHE
jgi:ferredoxin